MKGITNQNGIAMTHSLSKAALAMLMTTQILLIVDQVLL